MLPENLDAAQGQHSHQSQTQKSYQNQDYSVSSQGPLAGTGMTSAGYGNDRGSQQSPREKGLLGGRCPAVGVYHKVIKVAGSKDVLKWRNFYSELVNGWLTEGLTCRLLGSTI